MKALVVLSLLIVLAYAQDEEAGGDGGKIKEDMTKMLNFYNSFSEWIIEESNALQKLSGMLIIHYCLVSRKFVLIQWCM